MAVDDNVREVALVLEERFPDHHQVLRVLIRDRARGIDPRMDVGEAAVDDDGR